MARYTPIAIVAGLALTAAMVTGCAKQEATTAEGRANTATAQRRDIEVRAEAGGTIRPITVLDVKSKASGEVLALHVDVGDEVTRGTLIAEIDPRDVRNALAQSEADVEVARASHAISEAQLQRSRQLRDERVITEQEYERAALDHARSRASLIRSETNLELAQERMKDVTIRSPMEGTVINRDLEVGQIIASASQNLSGGTTLLQVADLTQMQVRALVDETDIAHISVGMPVTILVDAFPDRDFDGVVHQIEPQAIMEQNVTMFPLIIKIANPERLLRPRMNAEVYIDVVRRDNVLAIPSAAVTTTRDGPAAAAILGMDEETFQDLLRQSRATRTAAAPAPAAEEETDKEEDAERVADAGSLSQEECRDLFRKAREGSLSASERTQLETCAQEFGARRGGGGGSPTAQRQAARPDTASNDEGRPGIVFVRQDNGDIVPRRIRTGIHDWEYTEILEGLEEGDEVMLISVVRLQSEQARRVERMQGRAMPTTMFRR